MAKFKVIISEPESGKSSSLEVEGSRAVPLIGKRIGETIDGSVVGLSGYKVLITGGCDKDGFPMRFDVHGGVRASVLLNKGVGFKTRNKGERRRKTIRGNVITDDIVQINIKIIEKPEKKKIEKKEKRRRKTKESQGSN